MAREPVAGSSKTRLTPTLTPDDAAELSRCFVLDTIDLATRFAEERPGLEVTVAGTPSRSGDWFAANAPGVGFVAQRGDDLAARLDGVMTAAVADGYEYVLAVNSDSPTLPISVLGDGVDRLGSTDVDVVIGPAEDGGYYLIGWKHPNRRLVREVEMSQPTVLGDTLAIAAEEGLRVELLDRWYDVDEPADLVRVRADLDEERPCGARTTGFFAERPELGRARTGADGGGRSVVAVVPALNEADNIGSLVAQLRAEVDAVVVADNGSTDGTAARAAAAQATVVTEPRRGYGYACAAGSDAAVELGADVIVYVDGDHSSVPAEIGLVVEPITQDRADLVLGSRSAGLVEPGAMPGHQRFGNWLSAQLMSRLYGVDVTDLGPFRAIRRDLYTELSMTEMTFGWTTEMMVRAAKRSARIVEVPVSWRHRQHGRSKISGTVRGSALAAWHIVGVTVRNVR